MQVKKNIGDRIKQVRKAQHLTQQAFARILGITQGFYTGIETGKYSTSNEILTCITSNFNINLNWLLTGEGEMYKRLPIPKAKPTVLVPVLGRVPAGFPNEIPENEITEYVHLPDAPPGSFVLIVKGDSMSPKIKDGDYVIFKPNGEIKSGDVIVVNNEYGETMLKKYYVDKNGDVLLVSENPEYPAFKPNEHYSIIGKVIDGWRKVKF
ncbi:MAG: helix-turn-helix transcriptional regulator [Nitrospinae bacterium]|nr:helix-turn-helix transcriptional regulator [Nitrospinota bacterium]